MKVAVSSSSKNASEKMDVRFGRAKGFVIYDLVKNTTEWLENDINLNAVQGAGIQTAQNLVNASVDAVITGHCGPKAFKVLMGNDVKIFLTSECTVDEAVNQLKNNQLKELSQPDVESHW